jgi:hypothetical protein
MTEHDFHFLHYDALQFERVELHGPILYSMRHFVVYVSR